MSISFLPSSRAFCSMSTAPALSSSFLPSSRAFCKSSGFCCLWEWQWLQEFGCLAGSPPPNSIVTLGGMVRNRWVLSSPRVELWPVGGIWQPTQSACCGARAMGAWPVVASGTDVAMATQAKVVGVHGRGELGSGLVDAMACAAADPGFEMPAFSPFRILLPMHLDASTRPPGRHVRFRNSFEMLGSQIIPYLETYWKVPFLVRALPSSVTLAAYIRGSLERQRCWIDIVLNLSSTFAST